MRIAAIIVAGILTVQLCIAGADPVRGGAKYPDSVRHLLEQTRKSIDTIDMAQMKTALDKHQYDLLIDVREPGEFTSGHLPGAINIPRGVLEFKIWPHVGFPDQINYKKKIILYCKTGGRCTLAAKSLQDLGFTNVVAATMLFEQWLKAGYAIESID